ncbi:bifunctional adenylate cyclase toxin/hemolysin CyaA [Bordetella bronchiseptica]|nr:bifunctional adenylate cyclase toxin/hemolysin CyaA [Bordetella bronchiseptica]KDB83767.1 bifunctional hemolysin/adenylate cyclase [Bordetella bronchiseptica CARE970018BB]KDC95082.1 bifunctional hemolysin/adenylate cyclase [Bordetella bronchiseptica MBORD670]KDD21008.1 bifunctional hemolysin/adenylate cyclase [Bordetella bronchiseptica MBORD785]KDD32526.1 bifunctional hemolysin/adenylate cyclase [Bordetella bronchiseptica MBORD849]KDS81064.1 bifunctional hemolysin-adenylate cyclase [Bordete
MQQSHQAGYANAADRESGIPAAVLDGIKAVAKEKNATLMFRLVNPHSTSLIAEGVATKGLGVHAKSSDWGLQAGYIPVNPNLSKLFGRAPEVIARANNDVNSSLAHGHTAVDLTLSKERLDYLRQAGLVTGMADGVVASNHAGYEQFEFRVKETSDGRYAVQYRRKGGDDFEAVKVIGNAAGIPLTADIDMFAIMPHLSNFRDSARSSVTSGDSVTDYLARTRRAASEATGGLDPERIDLLWKIARAGARSAVGTEARRQFRYDGDMNIGVITDFELEVRNALNRRAHAVGAQDVVQHGTEQNNPFPEADEKIFVVSATGESQMLTRGQLKEYIGQQRGEGYVFYENRAYGVAGKSLFDDGLGAAPGVPGGRSKSSPDVLETVPASPGLRRPSLGAVERQDSGYDSLDGVGSRSFSLGEVSDMAAVEAAELEMTRQVLHAGARQDDAEPGVSGASAHWGQRALQGAQAVAAAQRLVHAIALMTQFGRAGSTNTPQEAASLSAAVFGLGEASSAVAETVSGFFRGSSRWAGGFGVAGGAMALGGGIAAAVGAGMSLTDDAPAGQKAAAGAEIALQLTGGTVELASSIALALAAARGVTSGLQVAGASAGAAAGALAAALSPMEIYGLVQQSHYADQLDKLAQESSAYGYEGDALLAQLYRDKTAAEGAVAGVSAVLSTVGAAVSIAAAASVVGAPVAVVTSLLTGALNGILRGVQQPIIEKLANDYARKIDELGGPQAYFEKNLQARHEQLANSDGLRKMLADLQAGWNASSVIGVQTTEISKSALELAAITGNADNLKSADVFVDRFIQGERVAGQPVVLDVAAGGIDIASRKGERPALTFITPLAAPGEEQRRRTKTGKSEFTTFVEIVGKQDRWRIRDGAADTTIDLAKVVSQLVDANGVLKHSIKLEVIGGDGDDVVLANASRIHYDGGAGTNTVSYAALGRQDSITVSADGERFNVRKQLNNANVYREGVATQKTAYGKRTENVQYRHVELARVGQLVEVDTLEHVQHIIGGAGNDSITGNAHDNFLAGGAGDDRLDGGAGNDTLVGGEGHNTVVGGAGDDVFLQDLGVWSNQLDGGAGVDTVKYNVHQPSEERLERMGETGIHADLQKGTVEKWPALNLFSVDHVKNIENLHGSSLNDSIAGDDRDNELWGDDGNDTIHGRGGDDILRGGLGLDTLYGEDGNDIFLQDDETVSDDIDGGAGLDTVDYSAMIHAGKIVAPHEYGFGIEADLSREWVRKASALGVDYYDSVRNVENVIGTSMKDVLIGDAQANTLMGQGGDDTVRGGDGDDLLFGGDGNDMLYGDAGNDTLYGGLGDDTLEGGAGNDWFGQTPAREHDVLRGGAGVDTVDYSQAGAHAGVATGRIGLGILADLGAGRVDKLGEAGSSAYDTVSGIENVVGTELADRITGDAQANVLRGAGGADVLAGGEGDDVLLGGEGDDQLSGDAGRDRLYGEAGDDWFFQDAANAGNLLDGGDGNDTVDFSGPGRGLDAGAKGVFLSLGKGFASLMDEPETSNVLRHIENAVGSVRDDVLIGDAGANVLNGLAGNDVLSGGAGDDVLLGDEGSDLLSGDAGNDDLFGGQGDDTYLFGAGYGHDTIYESGGGHDTIRINAGADQLWFARQGNDLEIRILGTDDALTVHDWYRDADHRVEAIHAANQAIDPAGIEKLVEAMAQYPDPGAAAAAPPAARVPDTLMQSLAVNWR